MSYLNAAMKVKAITTATHTVPTSTFLSECDYHFFRFELVLTEMALVFEIEESERAITSTAAS